MKVSANETMTLAAKAARGAGAPPAQAAAFGRAAVCHLAARRPTGPMTAALNELPGGPILDLPLDFAALAASQPVSRNVGGKADPDLIRSYAEACPYAVNLTQRGAGLTATCDPGLRAPRMSAARIDLPDDLARILTELAARILVPESAASRSSGAGAGLSDND